MNDLSITNPESAVRPLAGRAGASAMGLAALHMPLQDEKLDFVEYWRSISKRKWSILGLVVLVTVIAALFVSSIRPMFRSTATILIELGKSKIVSIEDVYGSIGANREYFQTQLEIMKSRELVRKVVERLKLTTHRDFDPRQQDVGARDYFSLSTWFGEQTVKVVPSEEDILKGVVARVSAGIQILPVRNSQLAQITYSGYDPVLTAKIPNTLMDVYIGCV